MTFTNLTPKDMTQAQAKLLRAATLMSIGHGFSAQFGAENEPLGWHGLSDVSAVLLDNLGEHEFADHFRAEFGDTEFVTWLHTDMAGFDSLIGAAASGTITAGRIITAYEALEAKASIDARAYDRDS